MFTTLFSIVMLQYFCHKNYFLPLILRIHQLATEKCVNFCFVVSIISIK